MTVREINKLCEKAAMGRGGYPFAAIGGRWVRIVGARTRNGQLEVHVLATDSWNVPDTAIFQGKTIPAVYVD